MRFQTVTRAERLYHRQFGDSGDLYSAAIDELSDGIVILSRKTKSGRLRLPVTR
jgi:hypothetical protein